MSLSILAGIFLRFLLHLLQVADFVHEKAVAINLRDFVDIPPTGSSFTSLAINRRLSTA